MERIFEIEYTVATVKNMSNVYVKAFHIKSFKIDEVEQECEHCVVHGYINFKDKVKKLKRKYLYNKLKDKIFVFQVIGGQTKICQSLSSSTIIPSSGHMETIDFALAINHIYDGIAKKEVNAFVLDGPTESDKTMVAMQVAKKVGLEYVVYNLTSETDVFNLEPMIQDWEKGKVIIIKDLVYVSDRMFILIEDLIDYEQRFTLGKKEYIKNPNTIFIIETDSRDEYNYYLRARILKHKYTILNMPVVSNSVVETEERLAEMYGNYLEKEYKGGIDMEETNFATLGSYMSFMDKITKKYKGGKIMEGIKNVFVNEKEGVTVVVFNNGDKVRVTREKSEKNDIEKAIAIAIVKYYFGLDYYINACDKVVKAEKKEKVKKTTKKTSKKEEK